MAQSPQFNDLYRSESFNVFDSIKDPDSPNLFNLVTLPRRSLLPLPILLLTLPPPIIYLTKDNLFEAI